MPLEAISLIIISALLHTGWNLIGKQISQTVRFYAWAMCLGMLFFSPLLTSTWPTIINLPGKFWWVWILSGAFQTLYLCGLAKAYQGGNLSIVYPLVRALPVVMVPLIIVLLYGQSQLTHHQIFAMLLIVLGAIAMPLQKWHGWNLRGYLVPSMAWVLLAAFSTAGYSITDSIAIQMMRDGGLNAFEAGSSFAVIQAFSCLLWMFPVIGLVFREPIFSIPSPGWTALAGLFVIGTYMLILVSMSLVTEVSYVVALRQISIPLGFVIGIVWLKEPISSPQIQGLLVMLTGLLMVSL